MPDQFGNVVTGKLNLKGGGGLSVKSKKRKRKSKKRSEDKNEKHNEGGVNLREIAEDEIEEFGNSETQEKIKKVREQREKETIKKMTEKTHRERIDAYNEYLGNLTEHHDIPRVSAAGNG